MTSAARPWQTAIWLLWFAGVVWITAGPFRWLLDAFRAPGPEYYRLLLWTLPAFAAATGAYLWVRRFGLWRYEVQIVAIVCLAAFLFYQFRATLLVALLFAACYGSGRWLAERAGLITGAPDADIPISTALGLAMYGPLLFALGMLHLYYWWTLLAALAIPLALFYKRWTALASSFGALLRNWKASNGLRSPLAGLAIVYIAIAAITASIVILSPSIAWDSIHYHLREASYYADQHALTPVPGLDYSYYPGAYEALLTVMVELGGRPAAQLPSPMFMGVALLLVWRLAREAGASGVAALTGIAAVITMPVFHWAASVAKNDLMLVLFQLAALECFLRWRRDANYRWILAGAFLLASSFDVKHVALFGAIPLGAMFLFAAWRQPARFAAFAKLIVVLVLFGTYWHARAFQLTGNPIYPESATRATPAAATSTTSPNWLVAAVTRPARVLWRTHFDAEFAFERPLPTPLGVFLLMFLPAWVLFRRREGNPAMRIMLVFAGLLLVYWTYTYPVLRYSLPAGVLLFVLTGSRVAEWFESSSLPMRATLLAATAYCLTFAMLGSAIIGLTPPQLRWLAGRIDDTGYLREALETYKTSEFLAQTAAPNDRVLGLEYFASIYSPPAIEIAGFALTRDRRLSEEFLEHLREGGYQWLVTPRAVTLPPTEGTILTQRYADPHYMVFHADR